MNANLHTLIERKLKLSAKSHLSQKDITDLAEINRRLDNAGMNIIRVRNLSPKAINWIENEYERLRGVVTLDPFKVSKSYVETTKRVLKALLDRLDINKFEDAAMAASSSLVVSQIEFAGRSARRSAKTLQTKLTQALA